MWSGFQIASHLVETQDKCWRQKIILRQPGKGQKKSIKKRANKNAEKNFAKAAAKQKCITSFFAKESERIKLTKWKKDVEDTEHVDGVDEDLMRHIEQN